MKPSWKDAPEWANYLAADSNGAYWFYENKPHYNTTASIWFDDGRKVMALKINRFQLKINSIKTLESRP